MPVWSPQQDAALLAVSAWLKDKNGPQVFRLFGWAGTGKSTLAVHLAQDVRSVKYAAFTGKAALVMRKRGCKGAQTIHSLIYTLVSEKEGEPRFVLDELQRIADSPDAIRRNRGRRGLEMLAALQRDSISPVVVTESDYPEIGEVDAKLVAYARDTSAAILTNDFNLNRVAELQGIRVLNINELANALKPVVLPGEFMKVFILKEGKEYNQGVAYLDDGTMVVVDNARRMISKNIDIVVTSVLQTTAGKMIFGRYIEAPVTASIAAVGSTSVTITCAPMPRAREATPRPHMP